MSLENDNRRDEQRRVDEVIDEVNKKVETLYSKSAGLKENVIELRKTFWDDVTVNVDEPDDVNETQASIKQQAELLSEIERSHGKLGEQLKTLRKLKDSPYFGRIDFVENPGMETDRIYIGISSLMDRDDENFLIYDWRAPISSLYYDYPPGKAAFRTTEAEITGEITLKRQFIIKQGSIEGMFDTGVTIVDQLLQQALGNNASTTMRSIVATIQKEQNKIIRNERSNLLIVQGVAGSGKTSAALQRIAYLMYRYREDLNAENIVLFSPNPLFTSYISNVLPELGEANVRQTTFLHYLEAGIGRLFSVESPFEQMEYVLTETNHEDYRIRLKAIDYKSGLAFKDLIDEFVSSLEKSSLEFKNISFRKEILFSKQQISDYFYALDEDLALPNKMQLVSEWLRKELRRVQKSEKDKDWVMEQVELLDKEDYLKAYHQSVKQDDLNDFASNMELEEEFLRKEVVKKVFSKIKKRVKRLEFVHLSETFYKLFTEWKPQNAPEFWEEVCTLTVKNLSNKILLWEDATPYVYFKGKLLGDDADRSVRHLLIDEAQDYSAFQFAYIKHIFPYTKLTLLGDSNQSIYTYATKENPLISVDTKSSYEKITLTKSYRSTKEIVDFTTYFAPGKELIEAFNREGRLPRLERLTNKEALVNAIIENIVVLREEGHETIALICKTLQESEILYKLLQDKIAVKQVNEETYSFEKGLLVLPVYLAKGIEFDAVIIPDASKERYFMESDRTIFYTACTRAMHALVMLTISEPSPFILEAPLDTYDRKK
ncbi:RNA polymerase recycling motor HelD [Oceanobacillus sp. CF4.6]|uniref:RNA polymerase recycling motor HelD n=1 Tax=Oceanobacillus sp. CF4.6 TaxID=3373080 RepID=UPI003EE5588A